MWTVGGVLPSLGRGWRRVPRRRSVSQAARAPQPGVREGGASVAAGRQARGELVTSDGAPAFRGTEEERRFSSRLSDAAAAIMNGLTPERHADLDALAARINALNEGTLHLLPDYGRMSRECLDVWRRTCRYYIPLHHDEAHPDSTTHPDAARLPVSAEYRLLGGRNGRLRAQDARQADGTPLHVPGRRAQSLGRLLAGAADRGADRSRSVCRAGPEQGLDREPDLHRERHRSRCGARGQVLEGFGDAVGKRGLRRRSTPLPAAPTTRLADGRRRPIRSAE